MSDRDPPRFSPQIPSPCPKTSAFLGGSERAMRLHSQAQKAQKATLLSFRLQNGSKKIIMLVLHFD